MDAQPRRPKITTSFTIAVETVERIDALRAKTGHTRSRQMVLLMESALPAAERKAGIKPPPSTGL